MAAGDQAETPSNAAQPVGTGSYVARAGDCIASIAFEHGLFWETVWNDPDNAEVKEKRQSPHLLLEGDRVAVAPLTLGEVSGATEERHRFRRKGVPAKVRIRVVDTPVSDPEAEAAEEPNPDESEERVIEDAADPEPKPPEAASLVEFIIEVDGKSTRGKTDGDGFLEATIAPSAREGRIRLRPGTPEERVIPLRLGHLDPIDTPSGQRQRLANLGFMSADSDSPEETTAAIALFQSASGLEPSGRFDDQTSGKLREAHGQ